MTTATSDLAAVADRAPLDEDAPARAYGDLVLYVLLAALVVLAWQISRLGYFEPGSDADYWLGVAGGTMMLLLFSYPLRKYVRFMHGWGKVKWWFLIHMTLGIAGPFVILIHSNFHLRSLNASVAFFSMLIVAGSGVVGRFLYVRIHRGLSGERSNLNELQVQAGLAEGELKSRLRFAPEVAERLLAFEARALAPDAAWPAMFGRILLLPIRQQFVQRASVHELNLRLRAIARERGWSRDHLRRRRHYVRKLARHYLLSVVRVAQFTAYERLFALWHVLHVPFVYLLVLTVGFHVFAVHAY